MSTITKDSAIEFGGKVWSKEGKELRVYLNKDAILKMADGYQVLAHEVTAIEKSKTYFDISKSALISDVGLVRSLLKNAGFDCSK